MAKAIPASSPATPEPIELTGTQKIVKRDGGEYVTEKRPDGIVIETRVG